MDKQRNALDERLRAILVKTGNAPNVYYQPPDNLRMQYPCIRYKRDRLRTLRANNGVYGRRWVYSMTVIDRDPDSAIVDEVTKQVHADLEREYVSENLYHTVFTIY